MMKTSEQLTLSQRAGFLYRQLLLLQRLFRVPDDSDNAEWLGMGDEARNLALCGGIREAIDGLTEHARALTTIPLPLRDWRSGDGPNDPRWRALTEVERRELLSLVSGYEDLIAWGEALRGHLAGRKEPARGDVPEPPRRPVTDLQAMAEYLNAERARIARFRLEMGFLERREAAKIR